MAAKESDIQAAIKEYLQWTGWFCVKIHQSLGSYRGIADLYALKDGVHLWIEVKTPRGRLSKHQERFRDDIVSHGGTYIVARSIEDVIRWIEGVEG
jgi:Holliday junction resolvase